MHQMTLFQDKKFKILLGRGLSPLPRPHPSGQGTPPPHTPPPSAPMVPRCLHRSYSAPLAPRLRLKDDLCFRLLLGPEMFWGSKTGSVLKTLKVNMSMPN